MSTHYKNSNGNSTLTWQAKQYRKPATCSSLSFFLHVRSLKQPFSPMDNDTAIAHTH